MPTEEDLKLFLEKPDVSHTLFEALTPIHNPGKYQLAEMIKDDALPVEYSNYYLIARNRKKQLPGLRFELINENVKLGEGQFGSVLLILHTLAITDTQLVIKNKSIEKRRVVKVIEGCSSVDREYQNSLRAFHLSVKPPVTVNIRGNKVCYLVMRHLPGQALNIILDEDQSALTPVFDYQQRCDLSLAFLLACKEQSLDYGLIHRDIKPENVICDLNSLKVNLCDYGGSRLLEREDWVCAGTPQFMAPEYVVRRTSRSLVDCYSAGRVLMYLWGDSVKNDLKELEKYSLFTVVSYHEQAIQRTLFNKIAMPDQAKIVVEAVIRGLCAKENMRLSFDEAISHWLKLNRKTELEIKATHSLILSPLISCLNQMAPIAEGFIENYDDTILDVINKLRVATHLYKNLNFAQQAEQAVTYFSTCREQLEILKKAFYPELIEPTDSIGKLISTVKNIFFSYSPPSIVKAVNHTFFYHREIKQSVIQLEDSLITVEQQCTGHRVDVL